MFLKPPGMKGFWIFTLHTLENNSNMEEIANNKIIEMSIIFIINFTILVKRLY